MSCYNLDVLGRAVGLVQDRGLAIVTDLHDRACFFSLPVNNTEVEPNRLNL
jgi:hypothetical protein